MPPGAAHRGPPVWRHGSTGLPGIDRYASTARLETVCESAVTALASHAAASGGMRMWHGVSRLLRLRWQLAASFFAIPLLIAAFLYVEIDRYGEDLVDQSSNRVMRKARDDVFARLDAYLSLPESVVRQEAVLATEGALPLGDEGRLAQLLLAQLQREPSVDFLYYANEAGGLVSVGREADRYVLARTPGIRQGALVVDHVDASGRLIAHEQIVHGFDPRTRDWYRSAKDRQAGHWARPYAGSFRPTLAVSTARPVIDARGRVEGVFGADVLLDALASYLR